MRANVTTKLAALLALALLPGPAAAQAQPAGDPRPPYVTVVGDLDGDGAADVVTYEQVAVEPSPTDLFDYAVTARRGSDGAVLWSVLFDHPAVASPLRLGGEPGLLVVETERRWFSGGFGGGPNHVEDVRRVVFTGLRGDGTVAWRHDAGEGVAVLAYVTNAPSPAVIAYRDFPVEVGVLADEAGNDRVAVGVLDRTEAGPVSQSATTVRVLDAADGTVTAETTVTATGARPRPVAVGDLDGDGLGDVLVRSPGEGPDAGVAALSGADLAPLWADERVYVPEFASVVAAGDLDGDGVGDLVLHGYNFPWITTSGGFGPQRDVVAFSGATGAPLFQTAGNVAFPLGDVDGRPGEELGVLRSFRTNTVGGVLYAARDGTGGEVVAADYTVPAQGSTVSLRGVVGDVDGDGVGDVAFELRADDADATGIISGRTGGRLTDAVPGRPLGNRAADRGAEFAQATFDRGHAVLRVVDGLTGTLTWASPALPLRTEQLQPTWEASAHDLDGDGLAEVVLRVGSGAAAVVYVLDGATGALAWSTDD